MKPLYDGEADQDDLLLQQAIREGTVPPGCQVGGAIVQGIAAAGGDPCRSCDVDREVCGGRPRTPKPPVRDPHGVDAMQRARASINDSATARKHQRQLTVMQLNKMIKEKKG